MKLLLVEDDKLAAKALKEYLTSKGYVLDHTVTAKECLEKIEKNQYDVLLLDYALPDKSGLEILNELKKTKTITI